MSYALHGDSSESLHALNNWASSHSYEIDPHFTDEETEFTVGKNIAQDPTATKCQDPEPNESLSGSMATILTALQ